MTEGSLEDRGPESAVPEVPSGPPFPAGPARTESPWRAASVLPHVVSAAVIVYLTYFFTMFFSSRPPAPAPIAEDVRAAAKKIDEHQAEDLKLLSNYGPVDPATQTLRIPIDRAMELLVAESHQSPLVTATAPTTIASATAPKPGPATAPGQPAATAMAAVPSSPPAKGGMSPAQLYHAVCIACHGVDGRGTVVRQAMPMIPDFTDPKWQASRTDADLSHSMLDGKGQLMLPMKDKLALAHTDVNAMLGLVRGFQPGHPAVAGGPKPAAPATAPMAVASAPAQKPSPVPAATVPQPATTAVLAPLPATGGMSPEQLYHAVCIACHGADGCGTVVRQAMPLIPDFTNPKWEASRTDADLRQSILHGKGQLMLPMKDKLALAHTDVNAMLSLVRSFQSGQPAVAAGPKPAIPATAAASAPAPKPGPATVAAAPQSAATTAKLRASAELFRTDCIVCHGPDGRGTTVRAAMPPIPDFTTREFQSTHDPAQLSVSILEGKGTLMPPWHGKISPEQARDLVAYVRRFGPADLLTTETPANEFGTRYRALKKQWDDLQLQAQALSRP